MTEHFTSAFAKRLNELCTIEVKEGADGDRIQPGRAIIAPATVTYRWYSAGEAITSR